MCRNEIAGQTQLLQTGSYDHPDDRYHVFFVGIFHVEYVVHGELQDG